MTNKTPAELREIAYKHEARALLSSNPVAAGMAHDTAAALRNAADQIESQTKRADEAVREREIYVEQRDAAERSYARAEQGNRERDAVIANVQALRDGAREHMSPLAKDSLDSILSRTPASSLAAHDAEVWDKAWSWGVTCSSSGYSKYEADNNDNPYRKNGAAS